MIINEHDLEKARRLDPKLYAALVKKLEQVRKHDMRFLDGLGYHQRRFVFSTGKKRAAVCSRRAGKSHAIACWLLQGGFDRPNETSLYLAQSKALARKIMGTALEQINRQFDLGLVMREIDGQLHCLLPNGHKIWLAGCRDYGEVDKFRGVYFYRVCIDEAQSYGSWLQELIDDVLEPALLDLNGEIALTGTPCPVPTGYFFEATTGEGNINKWPTFHWTCVNNPYIQRDASEVTMEMLEDESHQNPYAIDFLDLRKKANNWNDDNPTYRREWLGQWVLDREALVYPYDSSKNAYWKLPQGNWRYVISIDVGFVDETAWTIGAYQQGLPTTYVIHAEKKGGMIPSAVAIHTNRLMEKYGTRQVVIDSGGLGKGYQQEMHERYGIWAEPAAKSKKRAYQAMVAGELKSGNVKIHPQHCSPLIDEMTQLVWEDSERKKESEDFPNHCADSMLYLVRHIKHWYKPEIDHGALTKDEIALEKMSKHRAKISERMKGKRRKDNKKRLWARDISDPR